MLIRTMMAKRRQTKPKSRAPQILAFQVGIDVSYLLKDAQTIAQRRADHKLNQSLYKFCRIFFDTWSDVVEVYDFKNDGIGILVGGYYDTEG